MSEELKKEEVLTQTENQEELQAAAEPSESMADYAGEQIGRASCRERV